MLGPVEIVAEIDSTNAELLRRAAAGAPPGLVLVADHQTAGRGRFDRRWEAAPGAALLVSVLVDPSGPAAQGTLVTAATALAALDAVEAVVPEPERGPSLKWPNDLVVDTGDGTRKLAGILAEAVVEAGRPRAVVVGMGLNLRTPPLPEAISLEAVAGRAVARDELLDALLPQLERRLAQPAAELVDALRQRCSTIGRLVRAELGDEVLVGRAAGIAANGGLVVDVAGRETVVHAGDVTHLRDV